MLGLQKSYHVPAEAPVGEGATVRAILVEDEAGVWYTVRSLSKQLGQVEEVAPPADDEGRRGDLGESIPEIEGVFGPNGHDHIGGIPVAPDEQWSHQPQQPPGDTPSEAGVSDVWGHHLGHPTPVTRDGELCHAPLELSSMIA